MEDIKKGVVTNRIEEIQDIIERMPRNTGRLVVWIVLGLAILLLLFGWLIKYPEMAKGSITISAKISPVKLVSKTSGKLKLLKCKTEDYVREGEIFALIESSADLHDILTIDSLLKNFNPEKSIDKDILSQFPRNLNLGEMTEIYFKGSIPCE